MEGLRHRRSNKELKGAKETEKKLHRNADKEKPPGDTSFRVGVSIILATILLYKLLSLHYQVLPKALKIVDEDEHPDRFIAERAERDLAKLVDLGTKVSGSHECEVLAAKLIRRELRAIASSADAIHLIQEKVQRPQGSFFLAFKPYGFLSNYDTIQNIAVRIGPRTPSHHSVLVNCHFDTVPESPGASDNGLNCAVMLEVLRKISRQPTPLKHNIIFLFNGAEETPLQAAHGFITQHIWSKKIRLVVNLDSAGAGGPEILFQADPDHPWIIQKYSEVVPHPSASLAAQELFESGIIPSDTDYRIFRDFGSIPGVDLAHADNGYIYHTRLDTMDYIVPGVYQHTGDNILAFLRALANSSELEDVAGKKVPGARYFFYDLFGVVMVVYSAMAGNVLNAVSSVVACIACWRVFKNYPVSQRSGVGSLFCATARAMLGIVLGAAVVLAVAVAVDRWSPLSWYAKPSLIIPLYAFPYFATALYVTTGRQNSNERAGIQSAYGNLMVSAIILALLTLFEIRMSYFLMWIILPVGLNSLLLTNVPVRSHLIIFGLSSFLGVCIFLRNAVAVYNLLIPIAGRAGLTTNTEVIMAGLTVVISAVLSTIVIPLLVAVTRPIQLVYVLAMVHIATLVAICTTTLGFPYSADLSFPALQRLYVFHTPLKVFSWGGHVENEVSGLVLFPVDRNGLKFVKKEVPELQTAGPLNCSVGPFCGFPIYNGRTIKFANTGQWLDFPEPAIEWATVLVLRRKIRTGSSPDVSMHTYSLYGPDHITFIVSLRPGVTIVDWSLGSREPTVVDDRITYVVSLTNVRKEYDQIFIDYKERNERERRMTERHQRELEQFDLETTLLGVRSL